MIWKNGKLMKTVLIIDDDQFLLEVIAEILRIEGYKTLLSTNGEEGLCLAQVQRPDVIISDWMMPGLGGYALVKELQKDWRTTSIPFVMLTGSTDTRVIQQWTGLPLEQIVPKPFDIATLLNAIKRLTSSSLRM